MWSIARDFRNIWVFVTKRTNATRASAIPKVMARAKDTLSVESEDAAPAVLLRVGCTSRPSVNVLIIKTDFSPSPLLVNADSWNWYDELGSIKHKLMVYIVLMLLISSTWLNMIFNSPYLAIVMISRPFCYGKIKGTERFRQPNHVLCTIIVACYFLILVSYEIETRSTKVAFHLFSQQNNHPMEKRLVRTWHWYWQSKPAN